MELNTYARQCWLSARPGLGRVGEGLQAGLEGLDGRVRTLTELALGTLPASDVASVPLAVIVAYARHALFLRDNSPYCRDVPEDIFLHHVFYPRVNSEDLVDCREFFYHRLAGVVAGLDGVQAALAVNRWCAAHMTYETTDPRSINPLTAYSCGLGRCGEESTFAVTAFRAVGIPARQIYVPWWSHCDDNHAWVEVYVEGNWHFLGACEPEPVLDRGWFSAAASRAMLVCSRRFCDFTGQGLKDEAMTQRQGICRMDNQTRRYAATANLTVTVHHPAGEPVSGAWVRFSVVNMAAPAVIAALETGADGRVHLETGLGSCLVEAEYAGKFAWTAVTVTADTSLTLTPDTAQPEPGCWDMDFAAPAASGRNTQPLTPAQTQRRKIELAQAAEARAARQAGRWRPEYAGEDEQMLRYAGDHAGEMYGFLRQYGREARRLLGWLAKKDWRDANRQVLEAHLLAARALPNGDNPWVGGPRIGFELLTDWRTPVQNGLTPAQKITFSRDPAALWTWIQTNFPDGRCRWQPVLWLQPGAALALGRADEKGRRLLFVAVLRTLGVPARLNPVDGKAQYDLGAGFVTVEQAGEPGATEPFSLPETLTYGLNWGLARWEKGWRPLDLAGQTGVCALPRGLYRAITTNRLPNGNQLVRFQVFTLGHAVDLRRREGEPEQMLARYPVNLPVPVRGLTLQIYLDVGAEPTAHCLNELLENRLKVERAMAGGLSVCLLLPREADRADSLLCQVCQALPQVQVAEADFGEAEPLARSLYLEPGMWPMLLLTGGSYAFYAHGGYAVGAVPLALELQKTAKSLKIFC